jgi:hypothetical protein
MKYVKSFIRHFAISKSRGKTIKEAVKIALYFTKLSKGKW